MWRALYHHALTERSGQRQGVLTTLNLTSNCNSEVVTEYPVASKPSLQGAGTCPSESLMKSGVKSNAKTVRSASRPDSLLIVVHYAMPIPPLTGSVGPSVAYGRCCPRSSSFARKGDPNRIYRLEFLRPTWVLSNCCPRKNLFP